MIIKFWGVRGSIPAPGFQGDLTRRLKGVLAEALKARPAPDRLEEFIEGLPPSMTTQVGGNTPCLEVVHEDRRLIIDAGTGIVPLGWELDLKRLAERLGRQEISAETLAPAPESPSADSPPTPLDILLTHTHWDHIQGLPFFRPAYDPENTLNFFGADAGHIERTLTLQQSTPRLFPVQLSMAGAKMGFFTIPESGLRMGPFDIKALPLPHPGGSLAFRIEAGGGVLVFATDYELREDDPDSVPAREALGEFVRGADVFISDTKYTYLENITKLGWGHSNPLKVAEMALSRGVKKFFLFHHDPCYSDVKLFDMLEMTQAYIGFLHPGNNLEIALAIEGREISV